MTRPPLQSFVCNLGPHIASQDREVHHRPQAYRSHPSTLTPWLHVDKRTASGHPPPPKTASCPSSSLLTPSDPSRRFYVPDMHESPSSISALVRVGWLIRLLLRRPSTAWSAMGLTGPPTRQVSSNLMTTGTSVAMFRSSSSSSRGTMQRLESLALRQWQPGRSTLTSSDIGSPLLSISVA